VVISLAATAAAADQLLHALCQLEKGFFNQLLEVIPGDLRRFFYGAGKGSVGIYGAAPQNGAHV